MIEVNTTFFYVFANTVVVLGLIIAFVVTKYDKEQPKNS